MILLQVAAAEKQNELKEEENKIRKQELEYKLMALKASQGKKDSVVFL